MIGGYIFIGLYIMAGQWLFRCWITEKTIFKGDEYNPYRRYCRKCGQWQAMYDNGQDLSAYHSWWEEIYPLGNNPKCKCKKYARL